MVIDEARYGADQICHLRVDEPIQRQDAIWTLDSGDGVRRKNQGGAKKNIRGPRSMSSGENLTLDELERGATEQLSRLI
jgi:hypothetical protein